MDSLGSCYPGSAAYLHNIRDNATSAGPNKTLAAAGIAGFRKMLSRVAEVAPLRRNAVDMVLRYVVNVSHLAKE